MNAADLNRRIQILRGERTPDGRGGWSVVWQNYGGPIWARRRDVKDAERVIAGLWQGKLVTRFTIRATPFSRSIRRNDELEHEGIVYEIDGIKEVIDSREFLEITAMSEEVP